MNRMEAEPLKDVIKRITSMLEFKAQTPDSELRAMLDEIFCVMEAYELRNMRRQREEARLKDLVVAQIHKALAEILPSDVSTLGGM